MFYILMIVGIVFIVLGSILEKAVVTRVQDVFRDRAIKKNKQEPMVDKESEKEIILLEKRLQLLEEKLFEKTLAQEKLKKDSDFERQEKKQADYLQQYRLIREYEKENKSLDEISKLINMNKGEILLLKNLYKDS